MPSYIDNGKRSHNIYVIVRHWYHSVYEIYKPKAQGCSAWLKQGCY